MIVGENGAGKTHIIKAAYSAIAVSAARTKDGGNEPLGKTQTQLALANKLQAVFRPDGLWRLVRRGQGRSKCRLSHVFDNRGLNVGFMFSTAARTEVKVEVMPITREKESSGVPSHA